MLVDKGLTTAAPGATPLNPCRISTYDEKFFCFFVAFRCVSSDTNYMSKLAQAHAEARTVYAKSVKDSSYTGSVLKLSSNDKLGKRIRKGAWKGATIFTVTLEERKTCPSDCAMWAKCYGDNMPFAHRMGMDTADLMQRLEKEVAIACETYKKVAVRLHVLGDFFSLEYVVFWRKLQHKFQNLYIWGYTAHKVGSPIGQAITEYNTSIGGRWLVRFSNNTNASLARVGEYTCAVDAPEETGYVSCPEQTGKADSCGDCGLCWNHSVLKGIRFLDHSKSKKKS